MALQRLKHFGWGREGESMSAEEETFVLARHRERSAIARFDERVAARPVGNPAARAPPHAAGVARKPSARPNATTARPIPTASPILDYVRGLARRVRLRARRRRLSAQRGRDRGGDRLGGQRRRRGRAVRRRLERCRRRRAAPRPARYKAAVTLDLRHLGRVLEVDAISRAARIEGGAFGPALEAQLKPHGLTLRHFPQSFEYSTLGGWIATRSGGHFASLYTHIDDLVESLRVVTPQGRDRDAAPARLGRRAEPRPACSSAPKAFSGSSPRPGCGCRTGRVSAPAAPCDSRISSPPRARVRAIAQAGLYPANCRILDPHEACNTGAGDGTVADHGAGLRIGRPSARRLDEARARMLRRSRRRARGGGRRRRASRGRGGAVAHRLHPHALRARAHGAARRSSATRSRPRSPGSGSKRFHDTVKAATERAIREATGPAGRKSPAASRMSIPTVRRPISRFHALGRHGALIEQWRAIKTAARDALIAAGGTITHHHAVGRDHRPWYDRQRPPLFAAALRAAKGALDPQGMLNPGVLIDP